MISVDKDSVRTELEAEKEVAARAVLMSALCQLPVSRTFIFIFDETTHMFVCF